MPDESWPTSDAWRRSKTNSFSACTQHVGTKAEALHERQQKSSRYTDNTSSYLESAVRRRGCSCDNHVSLHRTSSTESLSQQDWGDGRRAGCGPPRRSTETNAVAIDLRRPRLCGGYNYDSTSIRRAFDARSTIKGHYSDVTRSVDPLAAVTLGRSCSSPSGRSVIELQSNRSCNRRLSGPAPSPTQTPTNPSLARSIDFSPTSTFQIRNPRSQIDACRPAGCSWLFTFSAPLTLHRTSTHPPPTCNYTRVL